jgi:hexosaminidase
MRILSFLFVTLSIWSCKPSIENPISNVDELGLIPQVQSIKFEKGAFQFDKSSSFVFENEAEQNLKIWIDALDMSNPIISLDKANSNNKIEFILVEADSLHPSAYFLDIRPENISIKAKTAQGFFYALQTFRQLLPDTLSSTESYILPALSIYDFPKFEWRGAHLDVCRHFFDKAFIKKYIDQLAKHKMNTFHWHLTEDQGWRIEIKKYPLLTSIGSKRKETIVEKNFDPFVGDNTAYGGFYTQDDIKEIVAYAAERFVTVVPEIEMPGHSLAVLAAYPELACTDGPFEVGTKWGVYDDVYCAGNDSVFAFLEDVLDEVVALFPSKFIHIGGDESPKTRWEVCDKCQARMKAESLKDEHELQSYFIRRIENYLLTKNRDIIGWDEILEGGLAPQATVMSWRGEAGGIEAAKQGHKVIMTPGQPCYFDHYQSEDKDSEPLAIGGFNSVEAVYNYKPIPEELPVENQKYILGAQANVWTEYMPNAEHVEYMVFPRLCALSEVVWTAEKEKDFANFSTRLEHHKLRLQSWGVNYRK